MRPISFVSSEMENKSYASAKKPIPAMTIALAWYHCRPASSSASSAAAWLLRPRCASFGSSSSTSTDAPHSSSSSVAIGLASLGSGRVCMPRAVKRANRTPPDRVCVAGPSLPHARACACRPELLCHSSTRNAKERDLRRVGRLGTGGHSDESPRVSPPSAVSGVSRTAAQPRSRWLRCRCCPKQRERTLAQRPAARRCVRCRPGSPEERTAPNNATWTSSRRLWLWEERRRLRRRVGAGVSQVFCPRARRRLAARASQAQFFAQTRSGRGLD